MKASERNSEYESCDSTRGEAEPQEAQETASTSSSCGTTSSSPSQHKKPEHKPLSADWRERLLNKARALLDSVERSADGNLVVQASTPLPTVHGTFDLRLFEFKGQQQEHLAISVGELSGDEPVLVRLHSECLTGEILGSLKCDCGDQLDYALKAITQEGRGLVLYLRQEGRGIGLANKLRAYALQALGADTVDANRLLGLPDDARQYDAAAAALRHLGVKSVRLLTNNPSKVQSLEKLGIPVMERVPVVVANNPIAVEYLLTKRERMDHQFSDEELEESA